MKNYTIANKNLLLNKNWYYGLSVEGRNKFDKGNKEIKTEILMQLLNNGNIEMPQLLNIMS
tara:strand:- start:857 stop:1039 length:183 start_codon:yes stop_codon:yes gene_type:complete